MHFYQDVSFSFGLVNSIVIIDSKEPPCLRPCMSLTLILTLFHDREVRFTDCGSVSASAHPTLPPLGVCLWSSVPQAAGRPPSECRNESERKGRANVSAQLVRCVANLTAWTCKCLVLAVSLVDTGTCAWDYISSLDIQSRKYIRFCRIYKFLLYGLQ